MNPRREKLIENIPKMGYAILLDHFEKEGNIGTTIRTAHAFGCDEVIVLGWERFTKFMKKSSRKMDRWIKVTFFKDYKELKKYIDKRGYSIIVIDTFELAKPFTEIEFPEKPLFIFGNETKGVSEEFLDNDQYYIPQIGTQNSINVANAAAIVMYHIFKERWNTFGRVDDWNCSYSLSTGMVVNNTSK